MTDSTWEAMPYRTQCVHARNNHEQKPLFQDPEERSPGYRAILFHGDEIEFLADGTNPQVEVQGLCSSISLPA
jgi:hypothetical protein